MPLAVFCAFCPTAPDLVFDLHHLTLAGPPTTPLQTTPQPAGWHRGSATGEIEYDSLPSRSVCHLINSSTLDPARRLINQPIDLMSGCCQATIAWSPL